MAYAYQKTASDMTVILGPREQVARKFDFGAWTEVRIGMFLSFVSLADNNALGLSESVALTTVLDRFTFGLKDDSTSCPGEAGSIFVGMTNATGYPSDFQPPRIRLFPGGGSEFRGFNGVTLLTPSPDSDMIEIVSSGTPEAASAYASFIGLKFVITDLGLATQAIECFSSMTQNVAGTDYGAAALRSYLSTFASPASGGVVQWNAAGAALPIPDCWFLRNPFFNNRIRISCMDVLKVAPV